MHNPNMFQKAIMEQILGEIFNIHVLKKIGLLYQRLKSR